MAQGSREIRRRIKSVNNTKKITRAMEMVAASKMRRATAAVLAIRPYAHSAWNILTNMARAFERYQTGLLAVREVKRILVIVVTSNRGLCGGFNSQLMKKVVEQVKNPAQLKINRVGNRRIESSVPDDKIEIDFVTVGKIGANLVRKIRKNIVATFDELTYLPKIEDVRALARLVMDEYQAEKYDKVVIAYTDYISTIVQQPKLRQILPISKVDLEKQLADMDMLAEEVGLEKESIEYKVEPAPKEVLAGIWPRLVEMQIYYAILESNASKESARMVAMRNATDAASDMVDNLTLIFNQIRQAGITQEIAEISAGRAALEN
ncbi:MAG: ATP synthase F1 subunit gamma [Candidatus Moranbacteria bacterium RIFOXYB1_FULL_43_19]|nr:MAG: ATP synthase F1 subunit gamma [Candidatus Moranbacteria bacterium RIFOXYB1_FULL_43_19]OGI33712.1 MAG: ATP synthase F1 subunit gamma [Candidatus Moranbacteria bacterium RIFOXYC1_FULL_44_13]OGI38079.1 MAG: ATP synthase F1 subunit gamma [Candidatus Moranbacteria bacterium RIFOXYD1_FULL_44_12]